ncbi:MAG: hypothetical protein IJB91_03595 [Oscillospiraceae bacterium]|nr:hypothetical protein [Oscillospiraceae bacterium]
MSYTLRLPDINAATDRGMLQQIKSYLYQMTNELNLALEIVDREQTQVMEKAASSVSEAVKNATAPKKTFAGIRDLIIKNAEFVSEFSQKISAELSGTYVAQSEFGSFQEETNARFEATSENLTQNYASKQEIEGIDGRVSKIETNAYIKTGKIDEDDDGNPVYGVAIYQVTTDPEGNDVYNAAAKFKPDGLELFDSADAEHPVAIFKNNKMIVNSAEVTGTLVVAGLQFEKITNGNYRLSLQ